MSTTTTDNIDPLLAAAETAWLEYAKGTYSEIDKRIFVEGFHRGVRHRQAQEDRKAALRVDRLNNWGTRNSDR